MNETCVGVVTEVEGDEVEEVDDQKHLGPPEVCTNEEEDKTEVEEVVDNEVASNTGGRLDVLVILGEETPDVTELDGEEDKPERGSVGGIHWAEGSMNIPVDLSYNIVQVEWSSVRIVLTPDVECNMVLGVVPGKGIVEGCSNRQGPGEHGQDLVGPDSFGIVRLSARKRVCCRMVSVNIHSRCTECLAIPANPAMVSGDYGSLGENVRSGTKQEDKAPGEKRRGLVSAGGGL